MEVFLWVSGLILCWKVCNWYKVHRAHIVTNPTTQHCSLPRSVIFSIQPNKLGGYFRYSFICWLFDILHKFPHYNQFNFNGISRFDVILMFIIWIVCLKCSKHRKVNLLFTLNGNVLFLFSFFAENKRSIWNGKMSTKAKTVSLDYTFV